QRTLPVARHALLYHGELPRPQLVLLPSRFTYDPACGCAAWPEDLDTDSWFKGTHMATSIDYFPGTDCRLKNGYEIFFMGRRDRRIQRGETNAVLWKLFALKWPGNLIVMKRGFRDRGRTLHITKSEVSLINSLVERCVFFAYFSRS
ncbi:hypothetical protein FKP32DRAFT_1581860, partial [Trametes sanguinea]